MSEEEILSGFWHGERLMLQFAEKSLKVADLMGLVDTLCEKVISWSSNVRIGTGVNVIKGHRYDFFF